MAILTKVSRKNLLILLAQLESIANIFSIKEKVSS